MHCEPLTTIPATESWYEGQTRHHTLESADSPAGLWTGVSGESNVAGNGQILDHTFSVAGLFFRVQVCLQAKRGTGK